MKRSQLETKYCKNPGEGTLLAYMIQKNYCSRLYKKEKKNFFSNLDSSFIKDNKKFWSDKTFFSEKGRNTNNIILENNNEIISDEKKGL